MAKLTQTKAFKKLLEIGSERGYVTTDEVDRLFPAGSIDKEKLEVALRSPLAVAIFEGIVYQTGGRKMIGKAAAGALERVVGAKVERLFPEKR